VRGAEGRAPAVVDQAAEPEPQGSSAPRLAGPVGLRSQPDVHVVSDGSAAHLAGSGRPGGVKESGWGEGWMVVGVEVDVPAGAVHEDVMASTQ
jgi:hypothetical protein